MRQKYGLTQIEFNVIMILYNNPDIDTASQIVFGKRIVKSHVSAAIHGLTEKGYLQGFYKQGNRKSLHLKILPAANDLLQEGDRAQHQFVDRLLQGFTEEEKKHCYNTFMRICQNAADGLSE